MIRFEASSGLCNRMRGIASAYSLASQYHTELEVVWLMNRVLNCRFEQLFEVPEGIRIRNIRVNRVSRRICRMLLKQFSDTAFEQVKEKDLPGIRKAVQKGGNVWIATPHQFADVGHYEIFRPVEEIRRRAEKIVPEGSRYIGFHIRRGDNVRSIRMSPTSLFTDKMEELLKQGEERFFLSTDSESEEERIRQRFGERIITAGNKVLDRNRPQGIKDALVDLLCLSRSAEIYGSYWSSFSETAALWNEDSRLTILTENGSFDGTEHMDGPDGPV